MPLSSVEAKLVAVAQAEFRYLTKAELALLHAAPAGEWAYYDANQHKWMTTDTGPPKMEALVNLPEFSESGDIDRRLQPWGPERNVRAKLIRWLCVASAAQKLVDLLVLLGKC
jgi:hypothetical protein